MHVQFDKNIALAGIGMVPWSRLGPEKWLPGYVVASLYGWDVPSSFGPEVFALADRLNAVPNLPKINTGSLLQSIEFQKLLDIELPGYDLLTYKPVAIPTALQSRNILSGDVSLARSLENKVIFRDMFKALVRFPAYEVVERSTLGMRQEDYLALLAGRRKVIIQDEQMSGGKGSFIVSTFQQYRLALEALERLSQHTRVVVSTVIEPAQEYSVQCCSTAYGVYVGPLQRQIVAHPELAGAAPGGDKFCGVQVSLVDQDGPAYAEVQAVAELIGSKLQAMGYRGIFGVDFLADANGQLYVLEVNPRITGATPLLTSLYRDGDIPFYLLHILELGGYAYDVDSTVCPPEREGSLLVVHSLESTTVTIEAMPMSGVYTADASGKPSRIGDMAYLSDVAPGQWIVQEYMPPGMRVKPGGRLAVLQYAGPAMDANGNVREEVLQFVRNIRQHIQLSALSLVEL